MSLVEHIHWLGHDSFRIDGPVTIYVDPWKLPAGAPRADLILITHDHFDHCSPDDVKKISKADTVVVTIAAAAGKLKGDVRVVKPGDKLTVKGISIEAVPAYNTNKDFHPKKAGHVGFIFTVEGQRIYHAGDTDFIPEMKGLQVDIALLPVSGTYVMTADEAVQAAQAINPQTAIPMHYGEIVGDQADAEHFRKLYKGETIILPLEK
ncbi:MAG: MBL fold metallo-hydrolase [Anaerolineae bacterium]|jgi:L-ascorbate metabolism protein UlaG (beta-lactamase superfamily)|nr:MBL fold metallo-hydrolase [Anaerolineae bacterium]MDH7473201.1 MBL fold metallo-hydrolase [Anaerolineae bacterium]